MPYRTTQFLQNNFYHIYNRGFQKSPILKEKKDRHRFIQRAAEYAKKYDVNIESSAILNNHFHFLLKQKQENDGIKIMMSRLQLSYAMYYNKKYKRRGQVFESRYQAKFIQDETYYCNIIDYIFHNPIK